MRVNDQIIEWGALLAVAFTCLAFGGMEVWSAALMEMLVFSLIALRIRDMMTGGNISLVSTPLNVPLILLLIIPFIQLIPAPSAVLRHLSPNTYLFHLETSNALSMDIKATGLISLYPHATWSEILKVASYCGLFFLIANSVRRNRVDRLLRFMTAFGLALALFGIFQHLSGSNRIYWLREYKTSFFGPFFNRNVFAAYMAMLVPMGLGLFFASLPLDRGREIHRPIFHLFSSVIMGVALFLTLSRGGMISFIISVSIFAVILKTRGGIGRRPVIFFLLFVALYILWIGLDPVLKRLSTLRDPGSLFLVREEIWQDTVSIFMDFPVLGTGLGTFEEVLPAYKSIASYLSTTHADNDYLQFLSETGIVGGTALLWLFFALLGLVWKALSEAKSRSALCRRAGLISGMVPAILYSAAERIIYIPAVAVLLVVYCALLWVEVWKEDN